MTIKNSNKIIFSCTFRRIYTKLQQNLISGNHKMRFLFFVLLLLGIFSCSKQNSTESTENNPPVINTIIALPDSAGFNESIMIFCCARDEDGQSLSYQWSSHLIGTFQPPAADSIVTWTAPECNCQPWIICTVTDPDGTSATDSVQVFIFDVSH